MNHARAVEPQVSCVKRCSSFPLLLLDRDLGFWTEHSPSHSPQLHYTHQSHGTRSTSAFAFLRPGLDLHTIVDDAARLDQTVERLDNVIVTAVLSPIDQPHTSEINRKPPHSIVSVSPPHQPTSPLPWATEAQTLDLSHRNRPVPTSYRHIRFDARRAR